MKLLDILKESVANDPIFEKWSEKYKKSINCKNPKGFSQRAHCQGRKKKLREDEETSDAEKINYVNDYSFDKLRKTDKYTTFIGLDKEYNPDPNKEITLTHGEDIYKFSPKDLNLSFYDKKNVFTPNQKVKNRGEKPTFDSRNFKQALQTIFPGNWHSDNQEFTPGLRGIHPFDEDDDWSILNFFDTNPHRMRELNILFTASDDTDPILWLKKFLNDNENPALRNMLRKQKNAVGRSDKVEKDAMSLITNNIQTFPKGHKKDRYDAIDAIDLNTNLTYQIKATQSVEETVDEDTAEIIYVIKGDKSRFKDYKNKKELNKILYYIPQKNKAYVFDNDNYKVISNDEVIHYGVPTEYTKKPSNLKKK